MSRRPRDAAGRPILPAFLEPSEKVTTSIDPNAMFTLTADGGTFEAPTLFDTPTTRESEQP